MNLARLELQVAAAKVEPSEAAQDLADLEGMFSDLAVTKEEGKEELKTTMEKLRRQVDNMVIAAGPKKEERYVSSDKKNGQSFKYDFWENGTIKLLLLKNPSFCRALTFFNILVPLTN